MKITQAEFIKSSTNNEQCPPADRAELAFIGRSNVGKSSLINMITGYSKLAKTSQHPGKTQQINHFMINNRWYLVDLPGYGYAKVSQTERVKWEKMIRNYLRERQNLYCVFVLIDSRHEPQKLDLDFMRWLAENMIPFAILFTKIDKQPASKTHALIQNYTARMLEEWEALPPYFLTSSSTREGREELLNYMQTLLESYQQATSESADGGKPA